MINPEFNPFPILRTERLILRELTKEDAPFYYRLRTDDVVMKYLDKSKIESLGASEAFLLKLIDERKANENINWGIVSKEEDVVIGNICYWRLEKEHHRAEIGYNLLPEYHQQGIMHEAAQLVLQYGFDTMNLHSVEAQVNPNNVASVKLLEKNNFIKEGHFKENYFWNGRFYDTAVYSLLKSNFIISPN